MIERWSETEMNTLIELYLKGIPMKLISRQLKRPFDGVKTKVTKLGIANRYVRQGPRYKNAFTINLTDEQLRLVKENAQNKGVTPAVYVREVLSPVLYSFG